MRKRDILNEQSAAELKAEIRNGVPPKDLQTKYGISLAQISQIKWGKRWAHVA